MLKRLSAMVVLLGSLGSPVLAEPIAIKDTFAFDWHRPEKSKCAKVTGSLLRKLSKGFTCGPAQAQGASGVTLVGQCTAKNGKSEYLLFSSAGDCTNERDTQLANGE